MEIVIWKHRLKEFCKSAVLKSFVINLILMGVMFLFFKPTMKSDDYYLSQICYGVYNGEYDVHLVYNSIWLGYIIRALLTCFPKVAWYTVLQIICVFVAFWTLLYIAIHKRCTTYAGLGLLFFSYDCYIRITFTKTAMVLMAVGILVIFLFLKEESGFNRNRWCLWGVFLCYFGAMWRYEGLMSVFALLAGIGVIEIWGKVCSKERVWKYALCYVGIMAFILLGNRALKVIGRDLYALDANWSSFHYDNSLKSAVLDYTVDNYELYEDEYKSIGVSRNDLELLYSNNLFDVEFLTEAKSREIIEIARKDVKAESLLENVFLFSNIKSFVQKVAPAYLLKPGFICFLVLSLFFMRGSSLRKSLIWMYIAVMLCAENYYLFLQGRVLQPHVDTGMIFTACMFLFYFYLEELLSGELEQLNEKRYISVLSIILICAIQSSYAEITLDAFYDYNSVNACSAENGRMVMEEVHKDKDHLYIMPARESVFSRWAFDTFEVMPLGYCSNTFVLGEQLYGDAREILHNYNVSNVYKDMINSEQIYFLVSDDIEWESVERVQLYIQEHYEPNAEMVKVREIGTANVYECTTKAM